MPYPFTLPTISAVDFTQFYHSPVYPSLPLLLTTHRGTLRNVLKAHKRLHAAQQNADLPNVLKALETYLPYLTFLYSSIHSGDVLPRDGAPGAVEPTWRSTLSARTLGADAPQTSRVGLEFELFFALSTLACTHALHARSLLLSVLTPTAQLGKDESQGRLNAAITHLLTSTGIFNHLLGLPTPPTATAWPIDLLPSTLSALSSLCLADATLLAVTKQDPFPSYISLTATTTATARKAASSLEWLYNPPQPPTGVKALLLARLCIAASDHAARALGLLGAPRRRLGVAVAVKGAEDEISPDLTRYVNCLRKVARAKACRFLGIDAEASGRVGEGIGWIALARETLGAKPGRGPLAASFQLERKEKRENRSMEKAESTWGADAGALEEGRVLAALEDRWRMENDRVFFHAVVEAKDLAAKIPSGREVHTVREWEPDRLKSDDVRALRGRVEVEGLEELTLEGGEETSADRESRATSTGGYY